MVQQHWSNLQVVAYGVVAFDDGREFHKSGQDLRVKNPDAHVWIPIPSHRLQNGLPSGYDRQCIPA